MDHIPHRNHHREISGADKDKRNDTGAITGTIEQTSHVDINQRGINVIIIHSAGSKSSEEIQIRIIMRICSGTFVVEIKRSCDSCLWNVGDGERRIKLEER